MFNYFSLSNITAGFIAVMVGFTSSAVLVFQAATMAGASPEEISSWLLALGVSIAITCIGFSLRYRAPILVGWSTPGAALLVGSLSGVSMAEAIGAFMVASALTVLVGVTGVFEKIMNHIPKSLTAAMLAGILLHFGMNVFTAMEQQFSLVCTLFIAYLIGKRHFPRFVILLVLLLGVCMASLQGLIHLDGFQLALPAPIFTMPVFTFATLIGIGMPLFIVNMTSQNIPGVAVIKASEYNPPISPLITWTGAANLLFAPFGCYSINLAAITATICMGKDAGNQTTRYRATIFAGLCWLAIGLFGATVVALFSAFPKELILTIAGLALFSTIGNSLKTALEADEHREPALITILVSASGMTLFGIGAAFWGLVAGIIAHIILNVRKKEIVSAVPTA